MSEELKPCPFCESGNLTLHGPAFPVVVCNYCESTGPQYDNRKKAVEAWNTRPIEDNLRAENERLRLALEEMLWQHGHQYSDCGKTFLSAGGLSANESAFQALGWDDPRPLSDEEELANCCEIEGCMEPMAGGLRWGGLYLHLCAKHCREADNQAPAPAVKLHAKHREAGRCKRCGCLPNCTCEERPA